MTRARVVDAALAAVATMAVVTPAITLFQSASWFRPAALMVLAIAGAGVGLRLLVDTAWLVIGGQVVVGWLTAGVLFGRGHLWHGIPGIEVVQAYNTLLAQALQTVQTSSAPAPTTRGIILALGLLIGVTTVAVDAIAVTRRSPTLAGLPLLAAYLGAATNSGEGLSAVYFVVPAALWVTMIGRQGVGTMRRWATAVARSDEPRDLSEDAVLDFASLGRVLGIGTIFAAVVITPVIPHLPTTFIAQGLGRSDNARGVGGSGIRLSSTIDIAKNLGDRSKNPVLTYETTSAARAPFRVAVLTEYADGQWLETHGPAIDLNGRQLPPLPVAPDVVVTTAELRVTDNGVAPPQLAVPDLATTLDTGNAPWSLEANGTVRVQTRVHAYSASFATLDPPANDFSGDASGLVSSDTLAPDPASLPAVTSVLARIIPAGATKLESARAIQAYLRGSQFTYSLTLGPTPRGEDPLTGFLTTRQGYCVQFATAMVMMARAEGIPARIAIGFLPGSGQRNIYTVVASDAHAWPELYFPRLGWLRFEPTPGARSGTAPDYTLQPVESGPSQGGGGSTSSPGATPSPTQPVRDPGAIDLGSGVTSSGPTVWLGDHVNVLVGLALVVLATFLLPLGAWLRLRRRRHRAADASARAEVEWESLLSRLEDVGITPPSGTTPRQTGQFVSRAAYLSEAPQEALGRMVTTVERARYAVPGEPLPELRSEANTVWQAALHTRSRQAKLRAALVPSEGIRAWGGWAETLVSVPRWASRRLRRLARWRR